ncbi:hypothetical protein GQ43DRAFT_20210 [Delitschia confertaspora ATCC 74209]|uniref:Uncharacterized protein n=1 Tax=Delitschia confertaspora ATCC 74209 TaxID=1513339 RepID=A0A9P4JLN4_9PLEO|nr:hypothetical protein GQ43DRAFT_20210 [Delitschia confertaspora ATCC 74209]
MAELPALCQISNLRLFCLSFPACNRAPCERLQEFCVHLAGEKLHFKSFIPLTLYLIDLLVLQSTGVTTTSKC